MQKQNPAWNRAEETSKIKIQETSRLSVRKPYAQNKAQHLDEANRQRTHQKKNKTGNYKTRRNEQV